MKLINLLKKSCTAFLWRVCELYLSPYQHLADEDICLAGFTAPYSPIHLPGGCLDGDARAEWRDDLLPIIVLNPIRGGSA